MPGLELKQAQKAKLTESKDKDDKKPDGGKPAEKPKSEGGAKKGQPVESPIKSALRFLKEVRQEFYKVSWPDLPQVVRESFSVLILVAAITLMVLGFDWLLAHAVFGPLEHFAR
ncbi:MAG TPA: preprotein translocase subunit SecE, partial [Chroococcales cyanobacterium]